MIKTWSAREEKTDATEKHILFDFGVSITPGIVVLIAGNIEKLLEVQELLEVLEVQEVLELLEVLEVLEVLRGTRSTRCKISSTNCSTCWH